MKRTPPFIVLPLYLVPLLHFPDNIVVVMSGLWGQGLGPVLLISTFLCAAQDLTTCIILMNKIIRPHQDWVSGNTLLLRVWENGPTLSVDGSLNRFKLQAGQSGNIFQGEHNLWQKFYLSEFIWQTYACISRCITKIITAAFIISKQIKKTSGIAPSVGPW